MSYYIKPIPKIFGGRKTYAINLNLYDGSRKRVYLDKSYKKSSELIDEIWHLYSNGIRPNDEEALDVSDKAYEAFFQLRKFQIEVNSDNDFPITTQDASIINK